MFVEKQGNTDKNPKNTRLPSAKRQKIHNRHFHYLTLPVHSSGQNTQHITWCLIRTALPVMTSHIKRPWLVTVELPLDSKGERQAASLSNAIPPAWARWKTHNLNPSSDPLISLSAQRWTSGPAGGFEAPETRAPSLVTAVRWCRLNYTTGYEGVAMLHTHICQWQEANRCRKKRVKRTRGIMLEQDWRKWRQQNLHLQCDLFNKIWPPL